MAVQAETRSKDLAPKRWDNLRALIRDSGVVHIEDISRRLKVSAGTVRRGVPWFQLCRLARNSGRAQKVISATAIAWVMRVVFKNGIMRGMVCYLTYSCALFHTIPSSVGVQIAYPAG